MLLSENRRGKSMKKEFRVFICYARPDKEKATILASILKQNGLIPIYDEELPTGYGFHDGLKKFIAHAHVFLPLITDKSKESRWVHQEIGYALALNIPIIPLTVNTIPGEMLENLQAQPWRDKRKLKQLLTCDFFKDRVEEAQKKGSALFECAELREERSNLISQYAADVKRTRNTGHVRQSGVLTSFYLPDKEPDDESWKFLYGGDTAPGQSGYKALRQERQELEKHAKVSGCSLIIDPYYTFEEYGGEYARRARLEELLNFLQKMPDELVNIAIKRGLAKEESMLIVGNWFSADAFSLNENGYRQTMFTRHAPTVLNRIRKFDEKLQALQALQSYKNSSSREYAIKIIEKILKK
jgi:hypothetical protein